MIILHGSVDEGRFLLWGESPRGAEVRSRASSRQTRRRHARTARAHVPSFAYDAGTELLAASLMEVGVDILDDEDHTTVAIGWFPTLDATPLASSPLIAEPPVSGTQPALEPWSVAALCLTPGQTIDLLCTCIGKQTLAPGIVVGADLAYWATAMRLAGGMVARQQWLPTLDAIRLPRPNERSAGEAESFCRARWRAVFGGMDTSRLTRLATAMPDVCRALYAIRPDAHDKPPVATETPAISVLTAFIDAMVDELVRTSGSPTVASFRVTSIPGRQRRTRTPAFDSLHDHWLSALQSSDGLMTGESTELAAFVTQVRDWQRPIVVSTATPFQLCFRLEEPVAVDDEARPRRHQPDGWYLRYFLQAAADPSLLIPAQRAWNARGREASLLARGGFNAREYLLLSLGQAARICPHIEDSLKTAAPAGYELDTTAAYAFLTASASALEQAGFGVLLPAWWTRTGTKLRLSARTQVKSPRMKGGSGLSLDEIVHFDWVVALGDETLSRAELEALARLKVPLVKIRGQWVQVSAEEIQTALEFWRKKGAAHATLRDVVQMALGTGNTPPALAFDGVAANGWIADFLAQLEGHAGFEALTASPSFRGTLRPYQIRGYSWLAFLRRWGLGACLADDMGLGKTIQTLALIQREWEAKGGAPVLLICPTSVVGNWQKEAARFTPNLPVMIQHGMGRSRGAAFKKQAQRHGLVISSYALLHRDAAMLQQVPWSAVILDEAQNIKNPETKQAKAARGLVADYRIALTGTPVENNIGDLWSIMEFLNPGFLGTQAEFKRRFFIPIQANRDPEAVTRLKRLTGPFILRRLKTDKTIIADLPQKLEMKVFCTLTREQASLYTAVVNEAAEALDSAAGIQRKGVVLATLSKLKQVCNHPAQFLGDNSAIPGRSGKLARLTEMLEEILAVGERALVFSQFAEMGMILRRHLQETFGREVLFLHGAVPKRQRDRMVERFQTESDAPPIFLLSLKAGGTGLNLTAASHVFHFDRWWNPAVENQATDRAFRIGQRRNVQVHKFLCLGTLEEKIDEMIERKQEVAAGVVGTGEAWLTELSTADLKELFTLRQEAVGE